MADELDFDVFISHSSRDKEPARELARRLKDDGLRVWFDEWEIRPGDMIGLKIERGLERSRTLVLLMSANAFASDWVSLERHTLLFRDPTNSQRRFIPIRLDGCDPPPSLRQFAYLDWSSDHSAYHKLLAALREQPSAPSARNGSVVTTSAFSNSTVAMPRGRGSEKLPGFSINLRIRLGVLNASRRKYILDFGRIDEERLSLYISRDNVLTFAFNDAKGESHPIRYPLGAGGVPVGEFVCLTCEVGISGGTTELRLALGSEVVASTLLPFKTDIGGLDLPGGSLGSDLTHSYGAKFDLIVLDIYSATLTPDELRQLSEYLDAIPSGTYISFDGTQSMTCRSAAERLKGNPPAPTTEPSPQSPQLTATHPKTSPASATNPISVSPCEAILCNGKWSSVPTVRVTNNTGRPLYAVQVMAEPSGVPPGSRMMFQPLGTTPDLVNVGGVTSDVAQGLQFGFGDGSICIQIPAIDPNQTLKIKFVHNIQSADQSSYASVRFSIAGFQDQPHPTYTSGPPPA